MGRVFAAHYVLRSLLGIRHHFLFSVQMNRGKIKIRQVQVSTL